jgi:ribonucleoside-diphosphate reductase alpha chain
MVMGHANIKSATSIIDYIFRMLGYEYQNRTDLVHVITEQHAIIGNPQIEDTDTNPDITNVYQPVSVKASSPQMHLSVDLSMGVQAMRLPVMFAAIPRCDLALVISV